MSLEKFGCSPGKMHVFCRSGSIWVIIKEGIWPIFNLIFILCRNQIEFFWEFYIWDFVRVRLKVSSLSEPEYSPNILSTYFTAKYRILAYFQELHSALIKGNPSSQFDQKTARILLNKYDKLNKLHKYSFNFLFWIL